MQPSFCMATSEAAACFLFFTFLLNFHQFECYFGSDGNEWLSAAWLPAGIWSASCPVLLGAYTGKGTPWKACGMCLCRSSWHRGNGVQMLRKLRWHAVPFANLRHWGFTDW
jgi:hypothetical protein